MMLLLGIGIVLGVEKHAPMLASAWRNTWRNGLARAALLSLLLLCIALFLKSEGRRRILWGCLILALTWLDFVTHMPNQNPSIPPLVYAPGLARNQEPLALPRLGESRVMLTPAAEQTLRLNLLPDLEEHYLVHRLAAFPDCNLLDGIPQAYGFFSLAPGPIADLANLPYVQTNLDFSKVMDFMGVSLITKPGMLYDWAARPTAMPLVTAGETPVFANDQAVIDAFFQTNTDLRRIVFLPLEARRVAMAEGCAQARVLRTRFENERVEVLTTGPAASLVVVSQTWYPAWKAYVDGRPTTLWRANYAFQAVEVPAGQHKVALVYEDWSFRAGVALSLVGLVAWLALLGRSRLQARATQTGSKRRRLFSALRRQ
jgi:hypothetical protein